MADITTPEAASRLRGIQRALAAVCAIAIKELERSWPSVEAVEAGPHASAQAKWTAGSLLDIETAIRILAAVADGETSLNVAAAVYLDPLDLLRIQREPYFDEDVLFFTNCEVCGGQLVSVGGGDGAPSSCAACTDPYFADEPGEVLAGLLGDASRHLFQTARILADQPEA